MRKMLLAATCMMAIGTQYAVAQPCFTAAACGAIRQQAEQERYQAEQAYAAQQAAIAQQRRQAERAAAAEQARFAQQQREQAQREARELAVCEQELAIARANAETAAQQAEIARQDRERQVAADRAAAETRAKQEAEDRAAAQLAAENSPDNHCKQPRIAGEVIKQFNSFQTVQDANLQSVDIEHLTTIKFENVDGKNVYICHGDFVLMNGHRLPGVVSTRINVAGNIIISFKRD